MLVLWASSLQPGFHYDISTSTSISILNGSKDAHNTSISTLICPVWIIALFSAPYLLDTVKQDGELTLMLMLTAARSHLT